jgi:hypothetical protein
VTWNTRVSTSQSQTGPMRQLHPPEISRPAGAGASAGEPPLTSSVNGAIPLRLSHPSPPPLAAVPAWATSAQPAGAGQRARRYSPVQCAPPQAARSRRLHRRRRHRSPAPRLHPVRRRPAGAAIGQKRRNHSGRAMSPGPVTGGSVRIARSVFGESIIILPHNVFRCRAVTDNYEVTVVT